jgi:hypothetical protein
MSTITAAAHEANSKFSGSRQTVMQIGSDAITPHRMNFAKPFI